jgi:hypothetical protein
MISTKIFSKLKIDRLWTIYIFWIINNHSFIQINFTCVLGLIKNEKKHILIQKGIQIEVWQLMIIIAIIWYVIP